MAARGRHGEADHFDVLPFISILICMLGLLLMVTMAEVELTLAEGGTTRIIPSDQVIGGEGSNPPVPGGDEHKLVGPPKKSPILVEWDGDALTIHPEKVKVPWGVASANSGLNDSAFGKLLRRLYANKGKEYLFIAVRPSGFGNLGDLLDLLTKQKVDFGYEPFKEQESLELEREDYGMEGGG